MVNNCAICLEECNYKTKCNHWFHKKCLYKWYNSHTNGHNCPYCKMKIHPEQDFGKHMYDLKDADLDFYYDFFNLDGFIVDNEIENKIM